MVRIEKKILPKSFERIVQGKKRYELRLADFEVNEGDELVLKEWDSEAKEYTGREVSVTVTLVSRTKNQTFWSREEVDRYGFQIIQFDTTDAEVEDNKDN